MNVRKNFREKFSDLVFNTIFPSLFLRDRLLLNVNLSLKKMFSLKEFAVFDQLGKIDSHFLKHPRVNLKIIDKIIDKYGYETNALCQNPNLTPEYVFKKRYIYWNPEVLAQNPRFNYKVMLELFPIFPAWYYACLRGFDEKFLTDNLQHFLKNIPALSKNPSVSFDFIKNNPTLGWTDDISCRKDLKIDDFISNPDLPWSTILLAKNLDYTEIKKRPEIEWRWISLANNPTIPWEECLKFPQKYIDMPNLFSKNPNLPFRELSRLPFKLDGNFGLAFNEFTFERKRNRYQFYQEVKIKFYSELNF